MRGGTHIEDDRIYGGLSRGLHVWKSHVGHYHKIMGEGGGGVPILRMITSMGVCLRAFMYGNPMWDTVKIIVPFFSSPRCKVPHANTLFRV